MSILTPSTTPTTRQVWPRLPKSAATVKCVKEDDGCHVHEYRTSVPVGGRMTQIRIEHHMHTWMDEHKRLYPHVKDVSANTLRYNPLGYWDTVAEAWEALKVDGSIPAVSCRDSDALDDDCGYADDVNEADCSGVVDGFGQVHSDADPGL